MNTAQILMMKYPSADFGKDILLRMGEDNMSIEIYEWNLSDPQPTQEQINAWEIEFDLAFRQQEAANSRPYPSIGAQLDMMYHDKINGTSVWEDTITQIKIDHPKPVI